MNDFFDNSRIFASVWKWKFHIVVVLSITIVASAIISGPAFITPKFKSTAKVYPVNISEVSNESETEHLLEYLQSKDITFRVIDAFELDKVYKISRDEKLFQTWMLYEYDQNVKYKKTDFESVEISVMDEKPERAKIMVDSIIVFLNDAIRQERANTYFDKARTAKRDMERKESELDSLRTGLKSLRDETGLLDYYRDALSATQGRMEAYARGGNPRPAEQTIEKLRLFGNELSLYQERIDNYEYAMDTLKTRHDDALSQATQYINFTRIVQKPFVADKKAYPIRWLIVFLATVAAAAVSVITVSLIDYIRESKTTV